MRGFAFVVISGIALALGGAQGACVAAPVEEPPPAAGSADEEAEALRLEKEAAAARDQAEKAAEEVRIAEEKALRARRRLLEKELALAEEALDAARASRDAAAEEKAASEVRRISAALAAFLARASGGAPPAPASGVPALRIPQVPFAPMAGLRPLSPSERPGADGVLAALDWLARHQGTTGCWDGDGFDAQCRDGKCEGTGGPLHDVGLTGLATLAFLGAGETHKTPKRGHVVRNALKWLKNAQDPEGCFGPRSTAHFTYDHALASLAMSEAYGLTQSPLFKGSAEHGTRFILSAQNPYLGWRYGVRPGDNDTSVTGWMVLALASARGAGIFVPEEAFQGALAWIEKVTEPEYGRAGYTSRGNGPARPQELMDRFPAERSEALTAIAVTSRLLSGQKGDHPLVRKGLRLLDRLPPAWDDAGSIDFVYWYFGSLATALGGAEWRSAWSAEIGSALGPSQRGAGDGCARGSWDPADPWGDEGGRVYSTAINALSLEIHGRYARVAEAK